MKQNTKYRDQNDILTFLGAKLQKLHFHSLYLPIDTYINNLQVSIRNFKFKPQTTQEHKKLLSMMDAFIQISN